MSLSSEDFARYLQRIGHPVIAAADLAGLKSVQYAHAITIPFENIDAFTGITPALGIDALVSKLVYRNRGGYCFEHNLLLAAALEVLGFEVNRLAARVLWHLSAGELPESLETGLPRTHMLLLVQLPEGQFIVDTGFGGLTPTAPIRLVVDQEQQTLHETFRLIERPEGYVLQARMPEDWKALYVFDFQPQQLADLQMMNWFVSTHPSSRFVHNLILARPHPEGRHAFLNNALASYDLQGSMTSESVGSGEALEKMLGEKFGVEDPVVGTLYKKATAGRASQGGFQ